MSFIPGLPSHNYRDLTGQTFNCLTVLRRNGSDNHRDPIWECRCVCGKIVNVRGKHIRRSRIMSCGCLNVEATTRRSTIHGSAQRGAHTPEYEAWTDMKKRINYPVTHRAYRYYGAQGVTICDRWKNSFANFVADVGLKPSREYSLDRFPDPFGNYEPGNVRWATASEQRINQRRCFLDGNNSLNRGDAQ